MEKLSGLILDHYDDVDGVVLKSIFPTKAAVPALVKSAHYISPEDRQQLPADVFALDLRDGGVSLRKFACTDAGNTVLSVEYFLKTAHKLPKDAQKVAAANLVTACGWYEISPPKLLEKVALGVSTVLSAAMLPSVAKNTKNQIQQNMQVARMSGSAINPQVLTYKPPMG